MAKLLRPPPSIEDFISYFVKWAAQNMRARVTVTAYWGEGTHFTEEYDGRLLEGADEAVSFQDDIEKL